MNNSTMFSALAMRQKEVYKNVALASEGSTITVNQNPNYGSANINTIIQGYRRTSTSNTSQYVGWTYAGSVFFTIDLKAVKLIEEIDIFHGLDIGGSLISENTPNNILNSYYQRGMKPPLYISYSNNNTSYTTLSSSDYTMDYIFSKNILPTPFSARYVRFEFTSWDFAQSYISGIELWGKN